RAPRAAARRERRDAEGGEAVRRGGAAGLCRVRRPHVPRRNVGGRRRRGPSDGGRAPRRRQVGTATHGARLRGSRAHARHTDRARACRRPRPRIPLLDPRPGARRDRARLPGRAAPPARIVSLVPSVTEILYALGAEERLVGVTDFCDYPPAARQRPSVGGMVNPNLEAIVALKPDLVIATTEGNGEETFAQLKRL